ncbi:MAG: pyrroloquinoline quinone-dependent dehydrogenase [Halioglobus sp.]
MSMKRFSTRTLFALLLPLGASVSYADEHTQWPHYGGSLGGGQYSDIKQINASNVGSLQPAWILRTGEMSKNAARPYGFQTNPILFDGKLLLSTSSGIVIAAEPSTGRELWRYDPELDRSRRPAEIGNRGVSAWQDPLALDDVACATRIYIGILDSRLIALDGTTGQPCSDFGNEGAIYLNRDVRLRESDSLEYSITSPPVIVGDTLISGSSVGDNGAVELELGIVRGFDARTGIQRWQWDPIPRNPNTPGHSQWQPEQARATGAANAWAPLAADEARDLVFIPTGSASPDFYGGERLGDNRWANSLVALKASTGEFVWGQQLVHHDVWDYDLPAQPVLVDLDRDGTTIPAVIQATKMGMLFTFHRETGAPLFAIEERAVPQSDVPGEQLSPTQPFPVAPPPLSRQHLVTEADSWGLAGFDRWLCAREFSRYRSEGIYTPPSIQGTLMLPSYGGGMNWGGIAFDPLTQTVVANSNEFATVVALIPRNQFESLARSGEYPDSEFAQQSGTPYGMRRQPVLSVLGTPCLAPPWGTISAVDMKAGTIIWQKPLGTIEDLAPAPVPNLELGVPIMGGPIVTAGGLIFTAGAADNYLRALDLESGEELWKGRLPAGGQATPMTYIDSSGKQFIVIAAGGHPGLGTTPGDYVVAFALPE